MHNYSIILHHLPPIRIRVSISIHAHPQKILNIVLGYTWFYKNIVRVESFIFENPNNLQYVH
jgi:hypothetical protein